MLAKSANDDPLYRNVKQLKPQFVTAHSIAAFPEKLSHEALKDLEKIGVEVKTGHAVSTCEPHEVIIGDEL